MFPSTSSNKILIEIEQVHLHSQEINSSSEQLDLLKMFVSQWLLLQLQWLSQ